MICKNKTIDYAKSLNHVGLFALSMFIAASAVYIYSPVIDSHADETGGSASATLSMSLSDSELGIEFTPTETGVFDSSAVTVTVNTDSTGGYELSFSSDSDTADMVAAGSDMVIASDFDGTVTSATMVANKWGYSTNGTSFSKIPVLGSEAVIRDLDHTPSSTEQANVVTIGIKVDNSLKSGIYKRDVIFSALAHEPKDTRSIFDITEMQEMTSAICKNTTAPLASATQFDYGNAHAGDRNYVPRTTLEDTRDGTMYLISRLADGNCWMSQNLELDLTKDVPIEASTINGSTVQVTPTASTQVSTKTAQTGASAPWASSGTGWYSMRPYTDISYLQDGITPSSTASSSGIQYNWEKTGNYYNWYAATAGSGADLAETSIAAISLCPKGWRLPAGTGTKSYATLMTLYGLTGTSDSTPIRSDPLNFVFPSSVNYTNGEIIANEIGVEGFYRTAQDAKTLSITQTSVTANAGALYREYYGYSIRCVAI